MSTATVSNDDECQDCGRPLSEADQAAGEIRCIRCERRRDWTA